MKTVTWILGNGKKAEAAITHNLRAITITDTIDADGHKTEILKTELTDCSKITVTIDGEIVLSDAWVGMPNAGAEAAGCVRMMSQDGTRVVVGIKADVFASISAALSSARLDALSGADAATVAYVAKLAVADRDEREYYAHVAAVDKMMTLGGKTY